MNPEPAWGPDGLAAAVVQDRGDGRVLMLGWMDAEAYEATRRTGEVHFHSRSRDRLWRKGETSGNVLRVGRMTLDCDRDAVLIEVDPAGPTCHRGTRSCFDDATAAATPSGQGFAWLEQLWATIVSRADERPGGSYTTRLIEGGVDRTSRKVAEEATEVLLAAKDDAAAEGAAADRSATTAALANEGADLLYHLLVLLAERGLGPHAVVDILRERHAGGPAARR